MWLLLVVQVVVAVQREVVAQVDLEQAQVFQSPLELHIP